MEPAILAMQTQAVATVIAILTIAIAMNTEYLIIKKYCMNAKINLEDLVIYDFSNLNFQENSTGNCFGCDSCDNSCDHSDSCDCDCDSKW